MQERRIRRGHKPSADSNQSPFDETDYLAFADNSKPPEDLKLTVGQIKTFKAVLDRCIDYKGCTVPPDLDQIGLLKAIMIQQQPYAESRQVDNESRRELLELIAAGALTLVISGVAVWATIDTDRQSNSPEAKAARAAIAEEIEKKSILGSTPSSPSANNWRIFHPEPDPTMKFLAEDEIKIIRPSSSDSCEIDVATGDTFTSDNPLKIAAKELSAIYLKDHRKNDDTYSPLLSVKIKDYAYENRLLRMKEDQPGESEVVCFENILSHQMRFYTFKRFPSPTPVYQIQKLNASKA
jgi:hypothetical protein